MFPISPELELALRRRAAREGLKLHVTSYGGSGTVFTAEWLNRRLKCMSPLWHELINHYSQPLDLGIPRLVMLADPPRAFASIRRRGIAHNVTRKLCGEQFGCDLVAGMVDYFDRWTALLVPRPSSLAPLPLTVFCKYETLHDHLEPIGQALGLSFKGFPPRHDRHTPPPPVTDYRLVSLRERFDQLPDFAVVGQ